MTAVTMPVPAVRVSAGGVVFALHRSDPAVASGPPVLLLHGAPQTALVWRDLMPVLGTDRVVLAPDLKGLGASGGGGSYDMATQAHEMAALVASQVDGPVDVVGHDWGGVLALSLAGEHPGLVRRLAVLNAPYRTLDPLRAPHIPFFALPFLPELVLRPVVVTAMIRAGWKAPTPPSPELLQAYADAYADPARRTAMLAYYRSAVRHPVELPQVRPERALVLWGTGDPVLPVRLGEAAVREIGVGCPDVRMVTVPGAGHFVAEEAPEVVATAVGEFLRAD